VTCYPESSVRRAAVLLVLAGCFTKPGAPGDGDGSVGGGPAPVARLLHKANFSNFGNTPGTTHDGFTISTSGIVDGELLLFIAQIDNGTTRTWPLIDGFTQLSQDSYGMHDTQTSVIEMKIADHEPSEYVGTYKDIGTMNSGASIVTLLAVSGADPMTPIADTDIFVDIDYFDTARGKVSGVVTTRPDSTLIYVNSGDWLSMGSGQGFFVEPPGFTKILEMGDHGDNSFDWGTMEISSMAEHAVGPVPDVVGSSSAVGGPGTLMATGYGAVIVVQPPR
jgi:hypothetical protein